MVNTTIGVQPFPIFFSYFSNNVIKIKIKNDLAIYPQISRLFLFACISFHIIRLFVPLVTSEFGRQVLLVEDLPASADNA